jgi:hypothetical protein
VLGDFLGRGNVLGIPIIKHGKVEVLGFARAEPWKMVFEEAEHLAGQSLRHNHRHQQNPTIRYRHPDDELFRTMPVLFTVALSRACCTINQIGYSLIFTGLSG